MIALEEEKARLNIGDAVLVRDESGVSHYGLVTTVHGPVCINAVYVSSDETKTDPYGRQLERLSSLSERGGTTAPGGRYYERI